MPQQHARYPKDKQNPPTTPGERPEVQPSPRQRVPDDEPAVEQMTTGADERQRNDPKRSDLMTPVKQGDEPQRT